MPADYNGRLSGRRWNALVQEMIRRYEERVEFYVDLFTEEGYPPFSEPLDPQRQYQRLVAWYLAGDDRFWKDPEATIALEELEQRFGPRPPLTPYTPSVSPGLR